MSYEAIYEKFQERLNMGLIVHRKKRKRIKDGRLVGKMELVNDYNANRIIGNDADSAKKNNQSHYQTTLFKAVCDSIRKDLTARPMRFEWGANTADGLKVKRAYDRILTKIYAYAGTDRERSSLLYHLLYSGSGIVQPYSAPSSKKFLNPKTEKEEVMPSGRIVSYRSYDPLRTVLDWNANPFDITGTSDFAIVHIGMYSKEYLELKYGADVTKNLSTDIKKIDTNYGAGQQSNQIESDYAEVQSSAGLEDADGYHVYEYFVRGGYHYTIINGYGVIAKSINTSGIMETIPLFVVASDVDPDSPYGVGLYDTLQQALDVISTAVNQIADTNSRTVKAPTYVAKGVLAQKNLSLVNSTPNQLVEVNINQLRMEGGISTIDIARLFTRVKFDAVTESSMFLIRTAMDNISYITGMNSFSLGGVQEKQIRVADAASTVNEAATKSSSIVIKNLEIGFLNPVTKTFAEMFAIYYDDFPELKAAGITKEMAMEVQKNIRVVNGSYLPADQFTEMQRTQDALNVALTAGGQSMDIEELLIDYFVARGEPNPERLFRDPLASMTQMQMMAIAQAMQEQGIEQTVNYINQRAQENTNATQQNG